MDKNNKLIINKLKKKIHSKTLSEKGQLNENK